MTSMQIATELGLKPDAVLYQLRKHRRRTSSPSAAEAAIEGVL
jgi:DNA-binding CsgD family transcriptional regulator